MSSRPKQQHFEPVAQAQAQTMYRVSYPNLPKIVIEARSVDDAADKYRDRFDLSPCREIIVEKVPHGGR